MFHFGHFLEDIFNDTLKSIKAASKIIDAT